MVLPNIQTSRNLGQKHQMRLVLFLVLRLYCMTGSSAARSTEWQTLFCLQMVPVSLGVNPTLTAWYHYLILP